MENEEKPIKKIISGIGIDFGTYYTKISFIEKMSSGMKSSPRLLPRSYIEKINPNSKGIFISDGIIPSFFQTEKIGNSARMAWINGESVEVRFKLGIENEKSNKITRAFLSKIYQEIILPFSKEYEIENYRITFPNQWNEKKTESLLKIFIESGFKISEKDTKLIIAEPYASVIYYTDLIRVFEKNTYFLIIDVGAGTTDISLIKYDFEKKEHIVDTEKGCKQGFEIAGSHIDESIAKHIIKNENIIYSEKSFFSLINNIETAKIEINKGLDNYQVSYKGKEYTIDKTIIRNASVDFINELKNNLLKIKNLIKTENIHIDYILTAGGSGDLFLVHEVIKSVFERLPDNNKITQGKVITITDNSIPFGASMEAANKYTFKDIVNHSICLAIRYGAAKHQLSKGLFYGEKTLNYAFYGENLLIELIKKGERLPTTSFDTSKIYYELEKKHLEILSDGDAPKVKFMVLKNEQKEVSAKELDDKDILIIEKVNLIQKDKNLTFLGKLLSFKINQDENRKINIDVVISEKAGDKIQIFSTSLNELGKDIEYNEQ